MEWMYSVTLNCALRWSCLCCLATFAILNGIVRVDERDLEFEVLDTLAHEEMTPLDVLHAGVMLRVVGNGDG